MYKRELRILLIDDDHDDADIFRWQLEKVPTYKTELTHVTDPGAPEAKARQRDADAVFLDYRLGSQTALDFLHDVRKAGDIRPIVILTGQGDEHVASRTMRAGADDYIIKDELTPERLAQVFDDVLERYQQRLHDCQLRQKVDSLNEAYEQLEKEHHDDSSLLTRTLLGSAKLMIEMLRLQRPQILPVIGRLKSYVKDIVVQADFTPDWQLDLATTLSHVGCIGISAETCRRYADGLPLSENQHTEFQQHPQIGHALIKNVPRFDDIAQMILFQSIPMIGNDGAVQSDRTGRRTTRCLEAADFTDERVLFEAQVLRVAVAYDSWLRRGVSPQGAISRLRGNSHFDNTVVRALESSLGMREKDHVEKHAPQPAHQDVSQSSVKTVPLWKLESGMVLAEHLTTTDGTVEVLSKGEMLTESLLVHLREFTTHHDLPKTISIYREIPASLTGGVANEAVGA